jgi:hypothetical protein
MFHKGPFPNYRVLSLMDSRSIFMAYGVILKHLEVDKIRGEAPLRGALTAFSAGKRGRVPFFNWCGEHCHI